MNKNNAIEIKILRYPKLAKCSSCDRVRDIYYKALIYDVDDKVSIVGDLELCKVCGDNLHRSQGGDSDGPTEVIKTFNFSSEG